MIFQVSVSWFSGVWFVYNNSIHALLILASWGSYHIFIGLILYALILSMLLYLWLFLSFAVLAFKIYLTQLPSWSFDIIIGQFSVSSFIYLFYIHSFKSHTNGTSCTSYIYTSVNKEHSFKRTLWSWPFFRLYWSQRRRA